MPRFRSQRIGSEAGFSLIELLVVTAILMFLSLFTVPLYNYLTDKARLSTSLQDLRVIEEALEAYQADYGHYPDRLKALTDNGYLPERFAFTSPWSTEAKPRYYFYTVSDGSRPRAYLLGDPGPQSTCNQNNPAYLRSSHQELLPCGTNPNNPARIFTIDGQITLDWPENQARPTTLSSYRLRCDPRIESDVIRALGCAIKTES